VSRRFALLTPGARCQGLGVGDIQAETTGPGWRIGQVDLFDNVPQYRLPRAGTTPGSVGPIRWSDHERHAHSTFVKVTP